MMLTLEDAYYDNHEQHDLSENKWSSDKVGNLHDGCYSHDKLGLAVAKMSYHVYLLGEGVVGQVAVTGKHLWISADKHVIDSCLSLEYSDGWQTQIAAGIRTIAVVAVVPYGVVQLGSLNKIAEDLKLVNRIRDIFFELQDSLLGHPPSVIPCSVENSSCLSDVSTRSSEKGIFHDCIPNVDRTIKSDEKNILSPMFPSGGKSGDHPCVVQLAGCYPKEMVGMISKRGERADIFQSNPENFLLDQQKQVTTKAVIWRKCEGQTSGFRDVGVGSEYKDSPSSHDSLGNKSDLHNVTHFGSSGVDTSYWSSDFLDSAPCVPEPSFFQIPHDLEKNPEVQTEIDHMDILKSSFRFSGGCELYEALGPAFREQYTYSDQDPEKTETVIEMPIQGMRSSNLFTTESGTEHLLQAVVANVCPSGSDVRSSKSFCKSVQSPLTTDNTLEPSSSDMHTLGSAGFSFDQSSLVDDDALHCLNSSGGASGVRSSKGFSSRSPRRCSEQLERSQEPPKINKKRARPGENCRPRPRDRQLIQDRIKELRELVPNGSKCSIDSLLERTIKNMLFMQCITKHADKLDKCAESKLLDKRGSADYEQGTSWAMEVGSHLKACPIKVENINMNGQMLVEMLCEDCNHFLEIAEAIRNLGLTILKGLTEACGEKTWICFVVEGQNNRNMHRMDILWPLVQILQSKIT